MRPLLTLWFTALALSPCLAQQPRVVTGYNEYDVEQFLKITRQGAPDGLQVSLSWLKYRTLFEGKLKVYDQGFSDMLKVRSAGLVQTLNSGKDSAGEGLTKRQNIQVLGKVQDNTLVVERVYGLEDDEARFTRASRQLPANDAKARLELAREIINRARTNLEPEERPPVLRIARQLEAAARKIERQSLPALPEGADAWLSYGRRYRSIEALDEVYSHPRVDASVKERAQERLLELHAERYLGRWLSEDDFRDAVGFAELNGRWVPQELVELRGAAREQLEFLSNPANPWPAFPDTFLGKQAAQGDIMAGQTKEMVLNAIFIKNRESRLPVRVDRFREEDPANGGERIWERWLMEDGLRLYFIQGRVFKDVGPGQ